MKRNFVIATLLLPMMAAAVLTSCHGGSMPAAKDPEVQLEAALEESTSEIPMATATVGQKTYQVADIADSMHVYKPNVDVSRCFFVISKKEYRLYVYEVSADQKDTALVAHFPVCYAVNKEAKTRSGDMCTPECTMDNPFRITQIQDATSWCHDFGDGRGSLKAYGAWFLRLETPGFTGVGIHGSTNNEASVPGRDSEGCIRMRDSDLLVLHDSFATIGTPVIIKAYTEPKLPFEQRAQQTLADQYCRPVPGNPAANSPAAATSDPATPSVDKPDVPASASETVIDRAPAAAVQPDASTSLGEKPSEAELKKLQRGAVNTPKAAPSAPKKPAVNTANNKKKK